MMSLTLKDVGNIYTDHIDKMYRFFYYKTLSRDSAEDLTSETFLEFTSAVAKGQNINEPVAYLYGVAKHVFIHFLRQKYQRLEMPVVNVESYDHLPFDTYVTEFIQAYEQVPTLEDRARIYIERLPDKQKEVVTMRVIEKMSPAEIAVKMGKDRNYVKTTLKRGFKSLKALVACTPATTLNTEQS